MILKINQKVRCEIIEFSTFSIFTELYSKLCSN